ncbi:DUF456 domain-containing protein [Salinirubellus salinus]|jgi:hypothetical protein|uniref:DUF456 domain-containing protein n=1 Tax=Salinirubellus salinus TaxID=1364945 RepID=A0A9E7UCG7_9EURY|nr:DUF456 domain-containing protein [Salinirubellus salinus]UWM55789.1 DUF456 domain-containing protein [Salinirubellus salinus]
MTPLVGVGLPLAVRSVPGLPAELFGFETALLLAVALCVLGVVGSVVPLLPGAGLSLVGVGLYWWSTGYTDPGPFVLVLLVGVGLTALVVDFFGGALTARAGGASLKTTAVAAAVGLPLVFVAGPVGLLLGIAGTVFLLELRESEDLEASARVAAVATVGVLASAVMQALLTATVLVGLLLAVAV